MGTLAHLFFAAEFSCNTKHLIVLTFWNMPFVCLYSDNTFNFFQFTYGFWSFMCYCLLYKAFFTQLSIHKCLPAIYNSLKAYFLFHTSGCVAGKVESVMYLCAAFSQKAGPVSHTGKFFHSHHFIHQEATAIKLVTFMDLEAFHRGAWLKHPNSFSSISLFFFF